MTPLDKKPSAVAQVCGYAMIASSIVLVLLTAFVMTMLIMMAVQPPSRGGDFGLFWVSLGFGLPFIAIGIALAVAGRKLTRQEKREAPVDGS